MSFNRLSRSQKKIVRRLAGGERISDENALDVSLGALTRRGIVSKAADGFYFLSDQGRRMFDRDEGALLHLKVEIGTNLEDIASEYGNDADPLPHLVWRWRILPVTSRPVDGRKTFGVWQAWFHMRDFDRIKPRVETMVKRFGFSMKNVVFPELSRETKDLVDRHAAFLKMRGEAERSTWEAVKAENKRLENMSTDHALLYKVSDMSLSVRTKNTLLNAGYSVLGDIVVRTESEILRIKGMGRRGVNEIKEEVYFRHKMMLATDLPDWKVEEIERLKASMDLSGSRF